MDVSGLKYGLHQSFTDKNRHIKRNQAAEFEVLSSKLDSFIKEDSKENFHEYLRSVTSIVSNNVYRDKDNTFKLFNHGLLYLHGLPLRILKKKIVGQMFKISFTSKEGK